MKLKDWFHTIKRARTVVISVVLALVFGPTTAVNADIYKCSVNGNTVFSDQPCSEKAEKVELNLNKPKQQDIDRQKQLTDTFEEESRITNIHTLHQKNKMLKQQIKTLEQKQQAELATLREKTYRTDDGMVVSTEQGLFKKMDELVASYQNAISELQSKIDHNNQTLSRLHQQNPKNRKQ